MATTVPCHSRGMSTNRCRRVPGRRPTSGLQGTQSRSAAEICDRFSFSQKMQFAYLMAPTSGRSNRGNLLLWFTRLPFCSLQRELLRVGPSSLAFREISVLNFSSSLPPLRWPRTCVRSRCPGLGSYKYYQDGYCSLSSFSPRVSSLLASPPLPSLYRHVIFLCSHRPRGCCPVSLRWCRCGRPPFVLIPFHLPIFNR